MSGSSVARVFNENLGLCFFTWRMGRMILYCAELSWKGIISEVIEHLTATFYVLRAS